jgi:predicted ester cyclase
MSAETMDTRPVDARTGEAADPTMGPSTDREHEVAVRGMFEALNRGDLETAIAGWAWDRHPTNHGQPASPEMVRWIYTDIREALDERFTMEDVFVAGDRVVLRATVRGTHRGVVRSPVNGGLLAGLPPTGRSYTVQHIHILQMAGDKIVAHWANRDDLSMMQQLGLLPS